MGSQKPRQNRFLPRNVQSLPEETAQRLRDGKCY